MKRLRNLVFVLATLVLLSACGGGGGGGGSPPPPPDSNWDSLIWDVGNWS